MFFVCRVNHILGLLVLAYEYSITHSSFYNTMYSRNYYYGANAILTHYYYLPISHLYFPPFVRHYQFRKNIEERLRHSDFYSKPIIWQNVEPFLSCIETLWCTITITTPIPNEPCFSTNLFSQVPLLKNRLCLSLPQPLPLYQRRDLPPSAWRRSSEPISSGGRVREALRLKPASSAIRKITRNTRERSWHSKRWENQLQVTSELISCRSHLH